MITKSIRISIQFTKATLKQDNTHLFLQSFWRCGPRASNNRMNPYTYKYSFLAHIPDLPINSKFQSLGPENLHFLIYIFDLHINV